MADELDYLHADFDLNSLTVPRLRSILVNHDISYPASAKKAQLIRILQDEVLPQARKLLRDRDRVRRTSDGITDMGSRASSIASDASSVAGSRRAAPRRSARASTFDTEESGLATPAASRRKTTTARSVGKHPRASDTETGDDGLATPVVAVGTSPRKSTARKLRRSEVLPSTEFEDHSSTIKSEPRDVSVFTDDNPFQSGSPSEMPSSRRTSHDGKRKSGGRLSTESPALRGTRRSRKSETPTRVKQEDGMKAPTRDSFDFASRLQPTKEEEEESEEEEEEESDEDELSAGEEFTPEEQLALENEQADVMYPAKKARRSRKKSSSMAPFLWLSCYWQVSEPIGARRRSRLDFVASENRLGRWRKPMFLNGHTF